MRFTAICMGLCLVSSLVFGQTGDKKLQLWATYYYVPILPHDPEGVPLLDQTGQPTGFNLNPFQWCQAAIEGTVIVRRDGQDHVFNYAGRSSDLQVDCRESLRYSDYGGYESTGKVLWTETTGMGKGSRNYDLVPFRTIAVDTTLIPIGSAVYIPAARGVPFLDPDGQSRRHDGYFFAADVGGGIRGNHIDVFLGTASHNPFPFIASRPEKTFEAWIVDHAEVRAQLEGLHR